MYKNIHRNKVLHLIQAATVYFIVVLALNFAWWLAINDFQLNDTNYYTVFFGNDRFLVFYILVGWEIVSTFSKQSV